MRLVLLIISVYVVGHQTHLFFVGDTTDIDHQQHRQPP